MNEIRMSYKECLLFLLDQAGVLEKRDDLVERFVERQNCLHPVDLCTKMCLEHLCSC